jgi:imidazolonepropionase-like amidohydrolase
MTPTFKRLLFVSASILASGSALATEFIDPPVLAKPTMITVYVAKKIVTMDPDLPEAKAVAVSDGKIISVGSLADLKPWLDQYPHQINRQFENKVLYPGFVDPHNHPLMRDLFKQPFP